MSTVPPESERSDADSTEVPAAVQSEPSPAVESAAAVAEPEPSPLVEPPVTTSQASGPAPVMADVEPANVDPAEAAIDERVPAESVAEPTYASPAEPAPVQTVYVTAPVPPRKKGNRGFGVLLAVAGAVVFTALFAAIIAVVLATTFGGSIPGNSFALFVSSTGFLVPTVTFVVVFALTAVILNRAGWPAWVIGSLVAAVAVYFGSIGGILLLGNVVGMTPDEANTAYSQLALSAPVVVATILTREVIIWFGLAIAARGRKVKARNVEARADYDRELAENRARYGA